MIISTLKWLNELRLKARENLAIYFSPFCVVSFPKSGRTWLRVFLAKYFNLTLGVPMDLNFAFLFKQKRGVPRIIFSHNISPARLKNKRVILLIRDPRDVAVSYYFQQKKRAPIFEGGVAGLSDSLHNFIRDRGFGIGHIIDYMNSLYEHRHQFKAFLLIKYEDCRVNPAGEFSKILKFLWLTDIDAAVLDRAIEYSRFENMKRMEEEDTLKDDRLRPSNYADPESFKVRRGKIGGYADYLSEDDIKFAETAMEKLNKDLGY